MLVCVITLELDSQAASCNMSEEPVVLPLVCSELSGAQKCLFVSVGAKNSSLRYSLIKVL